MKRLQLGCLLPCLLGLAAGPLRAEQPKLPHVEFTDQKLDNGLRVIIAVDRTAPVFGIDVTYNVGSRNEHPGRTGFAHLFEHMMFEGSENVGKGEHFILVLNNGGSMNAGGDDIVLHVVPTRRWPQARILMRFSHFAGSTPQLTGRVLPESLPHQRQRNPGALL